MINYLVKGKPINEQYSALKLKQLKEAMKLKCKEKLKSGVLLLQDNMFIHTAQVSVAEVNLNCDLHPFTHQT